MSAAAALARRSALAGGAADLALSPVAVRLRAEARRAFSAVRLYRRRAIGGLTALTVYGGTRHNRYLLETTGSGAALIDYDRDGRLDIFLVNGTTLEGFARGKEPTAHLYRNRGRRPLRRCDRSRGTAAERLGTGRVRRRLRRDGWDDLYVTYWGRIGCSATPARALRGRDRSRRPGGDRARRPAMGAGCAFLDYDRDAASISIVANYIDMELASTPTPESGLCRYKRLAVACGPPGLDGGVNALYRNTGRGRFADVSASSGVTQSRGHLRHGRDDARLRWGWVDRMST